MHSVPAEQGPLPNFRCEKLAFLKTHKTGGTTLRSILLRVAAARNATVFTVSPTVPTIRLEAAKAVPADMILDHVKRDKKDVGGIWHTRTRAFFSEVLGTSDYGFLTILRHPVDRYISHFYFRHEPALRARGKPTTLPAFVAARREVNEMALSFSLQGADALLAYVGSARFLSGLHLPVELLDYGLGLMGHKCGWLPSQLLYLPQNRLAEFAQFEHVNRNVTRLQRPGMAELYRADPKLYYKIAEANSLDVALYAAAQAAMLQRLERAPPEAYSLAVRVADGRLRLGARCREPAMAAGAGDGGNSSGEGSAAAAAAAAGTLLSSPADEEQLCSWFRSNPARRLSEGTGTAVVPEAAPEHVQKLVSAAFSDLDAAGGSYWHTLLGLWLNTSEAGAVGSSAAGGAAATWAVHHAREYVQRMVLYVSDEAALPAVRDAVGGALAACGAACAFSSHEVLPAAQAGGFGALRRRARWSAFMAHPHQLIHATQGSLRTTLLSKELEPFAPANASLCIPVVESFFQQGAALAPAVAGSNGSSSGGACVPRPCWTRMSSATAANAPSSCLHLWALPSMHGSSIVLSNEALAALPSTGRGEPLEWPQVTPHRLEVVELREAPPGRGRTLCDSLPQPRLRVPWCDAGLQL